MKYRRKTQDIKKRKLYNKKELAQRLVKVLSFSFKNNIFWFILSCFKNFEINSFYTRIKNFCVISGRSKGVHSRFKISRILLRDFSHKGYFFGLKKASW